MKWSPAVGATVGIGAVSAWKARGESWMNLVGTTAATIVFAGLVCLLTVTVLKRLSAEGGVKKG